MKKGFFGLLVFGLLIVQSKAQTVKVLFIGNSYTYTNNLPQMFTDLSLSAGINISASSSTPGGYTFQLHSTNTTTLSLINSDNWDYVIMHEQSQLPSFSPSQVATEVFPYAHQLDSIIHANDSCTQVVFFMTWGRKYGDASNCGSYPPVCTFAGMQQRLKESYVQMGDDNLSLVAPVGEAWKSSWWADSTINLWTPDLSHPAVPGTYLAACTIFETIFQQSSVGLTYHGGLTSTVAGFLQSKAHSVVTDSASVWNINVFQPAPSFSSFQSGLTTTFANTSVSCNEYFWDFGDGTFSADANPVHSYSAQGTYAVKLKGYYTCMVDSLTQNISTGPVGVEESKNQKISIQISGNRLYVFPDAPSKLEVFDLLGRELFSIPFSSTPVDLNSTELAPGIYLVKVTSEGKVFTRKWVVPRGDSGNKN